MSVHAFPAIGYRGGQYRIGDVRRLDEHREMPQNECEVLDVKGAPDRQLPVAPCTVHFVDLRIQLT